MVLLYGIPGEGPIELVANELEEAELPFIFFNPRHFEELDFILHWENDLVEGEISIGASSYQLSEITGIYNRVIDFEFIPEAKALKKDGYEYPRFQKMFDLFNQWLEITSCRVVNKASAMMSNASKPFQLSLIKPFFLIPETLLTNSPADLNCFRKEHKEVIYKSSSSIRSVVKSIYSDDEQNFQNIKNCATLFQKRLVGCNYRVHVLDDQVFAVKADAETVDYRYSNREGKETTLEPFELPADISEKCILLAKSLDLVFAGIDLFLTDDGEWYCFEVNPSPGFSYFENGAGQPIAKAVAEYLVC